VLIVEDEEAVRQMASEVLRRYGYVVLQARHAVDALQLVEAHDGPIHLLVTDVVMPHMSGRELAEQLRARRPELKVLFMSGYRDHAALQRDITAGVPFMQKPFTPDDLARRVRGVLDEPSCR
jgi:CheY-like chemotaxis protein